MSHAATPAATPAAFIASSARPASLTPLSHPASQHTCNACVCPPRPLLPVLRRSRFSTPSQTLPSSLSTLSAHPLRCPPPARPACLPVATAAKTGDGSDPSENPSENPAEPSEPSATPAIPPPDRAEQSDLSPTGSDPTEAEPRPDWAPPWLPTFLVTLRKKPWFQLAILLPLYAVHLFLFSTKGWKFKRALIPNGKNLFQSIGYDSVAGAVVTLAFFAWRRWAMPKRPDSRFVRNLLKVDDPPWKVPREAKRRIGQTTLLLVVAYLASGYGALFSEQILYLLAGSGIPLTVATTRAWKVLLGHLMWVYMGIGILRRLKPFFPKKGTWLQWKWNSNWLWWAIGGYYVSALFFNIADVLNQLVLPASLFEEETVVSKLINPENKDRVAMAIGSIGPCVSAPVFEEVLYRGFLLPALACFLPMWAAIPASSVLFAIHHLNPTMVVPLSMLGFIWAILYAKSGNLTVTILIHAMWNSRVFLGSLLGLGTFTDFE